MRIVVSPEAAAWCRRELPLGTGDGVRFFVRYGGYSTVHPGFSLGVQTQRPTARKLSCVADGVEFFMTEEDLWYIGDQGTLQVSYSARDDEIRFAVG